MPEITELEPAEEFDITQINDPQGEDETMTGVIDQINRNAQIEPDMQSAA